MHSPVVRELHYGALFVFMLQVGVGPSVYPQRPGQIECDVSI